MSLTPEQITDFYAQQRIFNYFRNMRRVHRRELQAIRNGEKGAQPAAWSTHMHRCAHCKRRMREQLAHLEAIVRPISPYLQERYS